MTATAFARRTRADRIARVLVLDMILWPGALFVGASLFVAWQVRESLPVLGAVLVATLFSAVVGLRQWGVMLGAVFASVADDGASSSNSNPGEDTPRLTGRGTTDADR